MGSYDDVTPRSICYRERFWSVYYLCMLLVYIACVPKDWMGKVCMVLVDRLWGGGGGVVGPGATGRSRCQIKCVATL